MNILFAHNSAIWVGLGWVTLLLILLMATHVDSSSWQVSRGLGLTETLGWPGLSLRASPSYVAFLTASPHSSSRLTEFL